MVGSGKGGIRITNDDGSNFSLSKHLQTSDFSISGWGIKDYWINETSATQDLKIFCYN